jgi:hypothetical protein
MVSTLGLALIAGMVSLSCRCRLSFSARRPRLGRAGPQAPRLVGVSDLLAQALASPREKLEEAVSKYHAVTLGIRTGLLK